MSEVIVKSLQHAFERHFFWSLIMTATVLEKNNFSVAQRNTQHKSNSARQLPFAKRVHAPV